MPKSPSDLFFEVIQHANGAFTAECLNANLRVAAQDVEQLYEHITDAVATFFRGRPVPGPESIHLLLYQE